MTMPLAPGHATLAEPARAAVPPPVLPPGPTRAHVIGWGQLTPPQRDLWNRLRDRNPEFRTPFFSLGFFDAVHSARGDVDVIVVGDEAGDSGFLPIHRMGRRAEPAGRMFNDAHNFVADPSMPIHWRRILRSVNLKSYDFHALVGRTADLSLIDCIGQTGSYSAELNADSASFLRRLERDHRTIRRQEQKSRKLAREVGPLSFEFDCRDASVFERVIDWKREQYRRTRILDHFRPDWTRRLVRELFLREPPGIRGVLSVLRAGDEIVAGHFGMVEGSHLHYWFPAYQVRFRQYSPGTALFKSVVREATANSITCIDMGYGEQPYKRKQTDTVTMTLRGSVSNSSLHRRIRFASDQLGRWSKRLPMKESLKRMLRAIHPDAGISRLN